MFNEGGIRELTSRTTAKVGAAVQGPQRERGLWSFLTWSFFLAQLAAGNTFAAGAAQANGSPNLADPEGSSGANASAKSLLPAPEARATDFSDPDAAGAHNAAAQVQTQAVHALAKADHADATSESGFVQVAEFREAPLSEDTQLVVTHDDMGTPGTLPGIGVPAITAELPDLGGVLAPVVATVDNLIDGLGTTLDGVFVPVVETVEDLAGVLGPTLDLTLAPVEAITDNLVATLDPVLEPVLAPVAELTEGVGSLLQPVGNVAGEIMQLADPVVDMVEPVLAPVAEVLEAADPILTPVAELAEPVVDLVAPVVSPLLQPLAPVVAPVLELLPASLGGDGPLGQLFGSDQSNSASDAVTTSGTLQFAVGGEAGGYELLEAGAYTEFGIAVQGPAPATDNAPGDLAGNIAIDLSVLVGDDNDSGNVLPSLFGNLQQEASLRGLAEGLV